jgi:acetyl-CoA carboxylase carboxyl transferase subunit alpha
MQEHAVYSVIPPEGCAAILWRDPMKKAQAAAALKLTSDSALDLGLIEKVLPEPFGGAHRQPVEAAQTVKTEVLTAFQELSSMNPQELREHRYNRFRAFGHVLGS